MDTIIISQYKDPFKPTSVFMECDHRGLVGFTAHYGPWEVQI